MPYDKHHPIELTHHSHRANDEYCVYKVTDREPDEGGLHTLDTVCVLCTPGDESCERDSFWAQVQGDQHRCELSPHDDPGHDFCRNCPEGGHTYRKFNPAARIDNAVRSFESASKNHIADLEFLSEDQIMQSAGGSARKAVDFTFEVALINRRLAARLAGTEPPAEPDGDSDWWVAPDELRSKEAIVHYMRDACREVVNAGLNIAESDAGRLVEIFGGRRPAFSVVYMASMHTMYHDAQLNFIQSLSGDLEMHWG